MVRIFLTALLTLSLSSTAFATDFTQADKELHMGMSAGISLMSFGSLRALEWGLFSSTVTSLGLAMLVGHMKENFDSHYDQGDMEANAIGASMGVMLPLSVSW